MIGKFATLFATLPFSLKTQNPVSALLTGLYKSGADETRTRDLLRDRLNFNFLLLENS